MSFPTAARSSARIRGSLALLVAIVATTGRAEAVVVRVEASPGALESALRAAHAGDILELGPGTFTGPFVIEEALTLRGRGGVIDGGGQGTVLRIAAAGARVEGITIRDSGSDIGAPDACVYVEAAATGAVLQGNTLEDCAFGIWVHETDGVQVVSNRVRGREGVRQPDRGNGIHLFNASNLTVRDNTVVQVRDGIYVGATENSLIEANHADDVRMGIHYMYSYHNTIRSNVMTRNVIGIALMESRNLVVEANEASDNDRQGLLFRDVEDSRIVGNRLERNGIGMFFFSSVDNVILDNVVIGNEMGLKIWAGTMGNRVEGNVIRGNREQVFYVGAEDQVWGDAGRGNHWGDYVGWDQDGDGIGDRPHRVDSFVAGLLYRHPSAVLLLRSPALESLSHLADGMPLLRTPTIVDLAPLLGEGD